MSAAEQPSRFSQAQLLIAALFAVVFTGETTDDVHLGEPDPCPEDHIPTIEPLRVRFASALSQSKWRVWFESKCDLSPAAADFMLYSRVMPSVVHAELDGTIAEKGWQEDFPSLARAQAATLKSRRARGLFTKVAAKLGVEIRLVAICYREGLTDEAWRVAHDFLARIDSGELYRLPAIHGLEGFGLLELLRESLGVTSGYLWECLHGYEHDARVRSAARAVVKAMRAKHGHFWSLNIPQEHALILETLAPFMPAQPEVKA